MEPALTRPRQEAIDHDDPLVHERRAARSAAPFPRASNSTTRVGGKAQGNDGGQPRRRPAMNLHVAVLGGGPGGYPATIRAAHLGAYVACNEREPGLRATRLRICVPTKSRAQTAQALSKPAGAAKIHAEGLQRLEGLAVSLTRPSVVPHGSSPSAMRSSPSPLLSSSWRSAYRRTPGISSTASPRSGRHTLPTSSRSCWWGRCGQTITSCSTTSVMPTGWCCS
jgi:hypothetical protein